MDKIKKDILAFKDKQPYWFIAIVAVLLYMVYKIAIGIYNRGKMEKITKQVNAENAAIQKANSDLGANAVRGETMQGVARSIKQVVDNYGFWEKWIAFNPVQYIQDINRLNGAAEARYISQWYNQQYGRSFKTDVQMIAYSENIIFSSWTAKGGRYSDIKKEVRDALY